MIVFIGVVSILGRQREEILRGVKGSSWLVVSWQGAGVAASTKSMVFFSFIYDGGMAILHNSTQCRKVWPQGSFHFLVNAPSSRRIGDSNSRPPDLELGALTKWLSSRMLIWILAGFSTTFVFYPFFIQEGLSSESGLQEVNSEDDRFKLLFNMVTHEQEIPQVPFPRPISWI